MLRSETVFNNFFRSANITPERFYEFGTTHLQALILANDKGQFDDMIARLTQALSDLQKEIAGVDINLNTQKTETRTVDAFIGDFRLYMSDNEPFIARQLGGRQSAGFKEMYPFGITEYSKISKTAMPAVTARIRSVGGKYSKNLDPDTLSTLQGFEPGYTECVTAQKKQKQTVSADRTGRKSAFVAAQLTLTESVHTVGAAYPGNVEKCASFFPFSMLYSHPKYVSSTLKGSLAGGEVRELTNVSFSKKVIIHLKNTGENASYAVWAGATPDAPMPENAVVVAANSADVALRIASLPDAKANPFYFIKNLSAVNTASYSATFTGLQKELKEMEAEQKAGKKKKSRKKSEAMELVAS
ncbi:MAG: hypothetical protein INR73_29365 [Williamsia sp.]|nr:hypothetical protein [Williamsia sp.]